MPNFWFEKTSTRLAATAVGVVAIVASAPGCGSSTPLGSDPTSAKSGFTFSKNAFSEQNFVHGFPESHVDAALLERLFGSSVCQPGAAPCQLTFAAEEWKNKANTSMSGGRCEGFSALSLLFFSGDLKPDAFGAPDTRSLSLSKSVALQRELAYWQSTQLVPAISSLTKSYTARTVMPALYEALKPDAKERYRIGIIKKENGRVWGGHALVPISYARGETTGTFVVRVYDSNLPDREKQLLIDPVNDRWEYEGGRFPEERSSRFYGDAVNGNKLYLTPVRARQGTQPCPFCPGGGTTLNTNGGVRAVATQGSAKAGVESGNLVSEGGASITPIVSDTGLEDEEAEFDVFLPGEGAATVALTGGLSSAGTARLVSADTSVVLSGLGIPEGVNDTLKVNAGTVNFTSASATPLQLTTGRAAADGTQVRVTIDVSRSVKTIETSITAEGVISLRTTGATAPVAVSVSRATSGPDAGVLVGGFTFTPTYTPEGPANQEISVDVGQWDGGGPLPGSISESGVQRPIGAVCANTVKDGSEPDVDCGGICATKCAEGKRCNAGADCASGWCSAVGTCVANACLDQRRSADETDVDCGGVACGACSEGQACSEDTDCATYFCTNGHCRVGVTAQVAVTGLNALSALSLITSDRPVPVTRLTENRTYTWPRQLYGPYDFLVVDQPAGQYCYVRDGVGTATPPAGVTVRLECGPGGTCGNGVYEPGEACDDHNTTDGDGCSAGCVVERGYTCRNAPNITTGSNGMGGAASVGDADLIWRWAPSATSTVSTPAIVAGNCAPGAWTTPSPGALWVNRLGCGQSSPPDTDTWYSASFEIPTAEAAASTVVSATVWADDVISDVLVNGSTTGVADGGAGYDGPGIPFGSWPSTLYRQGTNTITVVVHNGPGSAGNPDGLLIVTPVSLDAGSICTQ